VGLKTFLDQDSIKPGDRWRIAISKSLTKCSSVLVFWSASAAASREVKGEYEKAISLKKTVVPVRLDSTPLPEQLSQYHGVDFRWLREGDGARRLAAALGGAGIGIAIGSMIHGMAVGTVLGGPVGTVGGGLAGAVGAVLAVAELQKRRGHDAGSALADYEKVQIATLRRLVLHD
jgi:hypothetical protein